MKILHIISGLNIGGAELMLKRLLVASQADDNYQHSVISLTGVGVVGLQLRTRGIHVTAMNMSSFLDAPRIFFQLMQRIKTINPDIVQTWMYHADLIGGVAARTAGYKNIIWGIRTTDVQAGGTRTTTMVRKLCAYVSHRVPDTIVCAAEASRKAHCLVGYDPSRMVVISNGFDLKRLVASGADRDALRASCGFTSAMKIIGTLGRFNPAKDHENFVRAAGLIANKYIDVQFLMVGRGLDANNNQLLKWIEKTGHPTSFVLLGERSDVPACLAAMDIFCLSSRTEGFPNVVGEAMAMGLPCVATDVGDAAMLVADTGIIVPKENADAFAHALETLLNMNRNAFQQLAEKAKKRIYTEFTIDRARVRFEEIYQRLFQKGND